MRHHHIAIAIFSGCLLVAACGKNTSATAQQQTAEESLPKPDAAAGSVTGMPNPGTPSTLPPPSDNLPPDNEESGDPAEDAGIMDSNLPLPSPPLPPQPPQPPQAPLPPPTFKVEGTLGKPPADTMPTMPAHPPQPTEQMQVTTPPAPPQKS